MQGRAPIVAIVIIGALVTACFTTSIATVYAYFGTSTFGTESATVTVKGPFGWQDVKSVGTGPSISVSFDIPDSQVPEGYNYELLGEEL
jgi:hypothetical protein